jgi:3-hydroxyacyl-[acyl-carrier-protein] dehydratase
MEELYSITPGDVTENSWSFTVEFNTNHPLFDGHFPGFPIVPGAVLVQMVRELAEFQLKKKIRLKELTQVKFLKMVLPAETTQLDVVLQVSIEEVLKVKATFNVGEISYCKLSAVYLTDFT